MATTIKGQRFKTYTYAAASALTPSLGEQMAITAITGIQESPFMIVGDGIKTVAQLIAVITSNDTKVITANYTVESWVKRIVVNSTAAINITIPNTRPVNDELETERALASTNYYYLLRSGSETIEGLTSYGIYGTKKVTIAKTTSTAWLRTDYEMKPLLSDISRVMALNGDGIPRLPDNAAGVTHLQDAFATIDSWTATGGTASVAGGFLLMTYTGTSGKISRTFTSFTGKLIRAIIKTNVTGTVNLYGTVGGVADTLITSVSVQSGILYPIDAYVAGAVTVLYFTITSPVSGNILYVDAIYIGSGLYDTPVYDKACCNRMTNNGVLPVQGTRGLAMSFNGAQYLQADNPVIGTTGTIAFKFKRGSLGTLQRVISNRASNGTNGESISFSTTNTIDLAIVDATNTQVVSRAGPSESANWHSFVIKITGTTIEYSYDAEAFVSVAQTIQAVQSVTNLIIGAYADLTQNYNGLLADMRVRSNLWTQDDVTRYHNGDDAVDSQQKAQNNVPYAIKVCDSKGNVREPGLSVYADNTAALAGGLVAGEKYRTSTGVLMVVY